MGSKGYERARFFEKMRGEGWTVNEIGDACGISHQSVSQTLHRYGLADGGYNTVKRRKGGYKNPPQATPEESFEKWRQSWMQRILDCKSDGCWEWPMTAALNPRSPSYRVAVCSAQFKKYGYNLRFYYAYRLAYWLFKGEIGPGMTVDHTCFNPTCVNPDHLRLVTLSANASNHSGDWYEKVRKNRGREFVA